MTIAIFQALIVSLGDIYLLKVYVSNKPIFILFSIFISIIFSMIIYTLVSVFGNVGKALGVILLVLQISASGGTFPIEVTPGFFSKDKSIITFYLCCIRYERSGGGGYRRYTFKRYSNIANLFYSINTISLIIKEKIRENKQKLYEKV